MAEEMPGIVTKILLPQRRPDVLRRPRLMEFLHQHIDHRLLLVSAPAGYGKTTLLIDFAHDLSFPACWYSLDDSDGDPRVFFQYLIATIQQRFPEFGHQAQSLLRAIGDVGKEMKSIVGVIVNEIQSTIPQYFAVVLDDYHCVDDSDDVNEAIDLLLYYLPEHCHIILATRTLPRLTLSRLAAHRQVAGLGMRDLMFTAQEIRELMSKNFKLILPENRAEEMAVESEGWITGILLTTHTLWQGLFETIVRARKSGGEIFDYLAMEVYQQQSEEVQRFLLSTSILPRLNHGQCDELLGIANSREILAYLEDINLFIVRLDEEGEWYRYHNLFQEFLEAKLKTEFPAQFHEQNLRAARLAESARDWNQAINHYLKIADYRQVVRIIDAVAERMLNAGQWRTVARWIDMLPEMEMLRYPSVLIHKATILGQIGELDKAIDYLNLACDRLLQSGDREAAARCFILRSTARRLKGRHYEAIEDSQQALELVPFERSPIAAQAHKNLGLCCWMLGDSARGAAELERALDIAEANDDVYNLAMLHLDHGDLCVTTGELDNSHYHYREAIRYWQRLGNAGYLGQTLNGIAVLLYYRGQYDEALQTLEEALAKAREVGYLRVEAYALASVGDVHLDLRRHKEALEAYEMSLEIARRVDEAFLIAYCLGAIGMVHRLAGEMVTAEKFVKRALQLATARKSHFEIGLFETLLGILCNDRGEALHGQRYLRHACRCLRRSNAQRELARAKIHLANASFLRGQTDQAMKHLADVLEMAARLGYDQFLVVEGRSARPLIEFAVARGLGATQLQSVLRRVGDASPLPAEQSAFTPLVEVQLDRPHSVEVFALGHSRVVCDGRVITTADWATEKTKEMFFYFLSHPDGLRREQVVDGLWPDQPPGKGDGCFHSTMYRLRRALYNDCIIYDNGQYRLNVAGNFYCDAEEFENLIAQADRLNPDPAQVDLYRQAIELYRGTFIDDLYVNWCEDQRQSLEDAYLRALYALSRFHIDRGDYQTGLSFLDRIIARDSFSEEAHCEKMRCLMLMGQQSAAIKHYRRYRDSLERDLGVNPSPKIKAVYQEVLRDVVPSRPQPSR